MIHKQYEPPYNIKSPGICATLQQILSHQRFRQTTTNKTTMTMMDIRTV